MKTAADYPRLGPLNLRPGDKVRVVGPSCIRWTGHQGETRNIVSSDFATSIGTHGYFSGGEYATSDATAELNAANAHWYPASSLEVVERVGLDDATPASDTQAQGTNALILDLCGGAKDQAAVDIASKLTNPDALAPIDDATWLAIPEHHRRGFTACYATMIMEVVAPIVALLGGTR